MSQLRRWSEDGATQDERLLLDSSRAERPDAAARARTLAALGVGPPPKGGGPTSGSGGIGGARRGAPAKLLAIGAGVVALGAATIGAIWIGQVRSTGHVATATAPATARTATSSTVSTPRAPVAKASANDAVVVPAPTAPPASGGAPALRPKRLRPTSAAPSGASAARNDSAAPEPSLAEEVAALEGARAALAAGDPANTLRALERYRARFTHGRLSSEEAMLRVRALLARGDRAGAVAAERAFSTAHPESTYSPRVRALLRADGADGKK